ncbi:MAG: permease-like cell division protein FtsX [Bacteroidales bacterium]|jgi:cell division transport system permease protein|nr:permease-like cell division protein FtsX [Bacteroidales bacterium]
MKNKESKLIQKRLRSSYATSIISISLVLCMLGTIGILLLTAHRISKYVKENIGFSVFLKEQVKEADIYRLQKTLDAEPYIRSTRYVTKDDAAREFTEDLGEDFSGFLGYNPLSASIEAKLDARYANNDSIRNIESRLQSFDEVKEVSYQKSMIHILNENIKKISLFIFAFSALLFFIAVSLINNTIRLSVYSRRLLIRTMQLVGATNIFIRRPFLWRSALHGIYSAFIAMAILVLSLYWAEGQLEDILSVKDVQILGGLFLIVFFLGITLSWISTYFAVNKYLNIKTDKLYY